MKTPIALLLILACLLAPWFSSAQNNNQGWSLAAYYTPQYSNQFGSILTDSEGFDIRPGLSATLGIEGAISLQEKIFLTAGFAYFQKVEKTAVSDLRWGSEFNGSGGWEADPSLPRELYSQNLSRNIQIPIGVQFYFGEERLRGYLKPGVVFERLLDAAYNQILVFDDGREEKSSTPVIIPPSFNRNNILVTLGLGMEWNLIKQLSLFVEGEYRLDLPEFQSNPFLSKRYDLGARLGLRFSFGPHKEI